MKHEVSLSLLKHVITSDTTRILEPYVSFERSDVFFSLGQPLGTCVVKAPTGQPSIETAKATLVSFLSPAFHLDCGLQHPEAKYFLKYWDLPASNIIDSDLLYPN